MKRLTLFLACVLLATGCSKSPSLVWKYQTGGYIYNSPVLAGNQVVIGSADGYLYGIHSQTGALTWKTKLAEQIYSSGVEDRGSVLVGSRSGDFFSINPANGAIQWRFHSNSDVQYTACTDESGIYFGSDDGNLYKITRDGQRIWSFQAKLRVRGSCVFYKDLVLTSSWDSNLYAISKETGELRWSFSTKKINYSPPVVDGEDVYLTSHHKLYRLKASDGTLLKESEMGYAEELRLWQGYLYTCENVFHKRDKTGADVAISKAVTANKFCPVPADGFIIAGGSRYLYGFSPDMKLLWKYTGDDDFHTAGVIRDGIYYSGNRDTFVYALRLP